MREFEVAVNCRISYPVGLSTMFGPTENISAETPDEALLIYVKKHPQMLCLDSSAVIKERHQADVSAYVQLAEDLMRKAKIEEIQQKIDAMTKAIAELERRK